MSLLHKSGTSEGAIKAWEKRKQSQARVTGPTSTGVYGPEKMTEHGFRDNIPDGYAYNPSLQHEADVHSNRGKITLGPKFFRLDEAARRHTIVHEYAHELESSLTPDEWPAVFDAASSGILGVRHESGYINGPNGAHTPGEIITETYALMYSDDSFLKEKFPQTREFVAQLAEKKGMPLPPYVMRDLTKSGTSEGAIKAWEKRRRAQASPVPITDTKVAWTAKEAAQRRLDALFAKEKATYDQLANLPTDKLATAGMLGVALWRERMGGKQLKWDAEALAFARGDKKAAAAILARFEKESEAMHPEKVSERVRNDLETVLSQGLGPKMDVMEKRFGVLPVEAGVQAPDGNKLVPQAEMAGSIIRFYDTHFEPPGVVDETPFPGALTSASFGGTAGVLRHEYGHYVSDRLNASGGMSSRALDKVYSAWVDYKNDYEQKFNAATDVDGRVAAGKDIISSYSLSKHGEGFAEAFAVLMSPKYDRSKFSGKALAYLDAVEEAIR